MSTCDVCNSVFGSRQAARQHKKSTKHCVCQHCNKILSSSQDLQAHQDAVHSHTCPTCAITLPEKASLTKHQKSKRHCYCGDCNMVFSTIRGLQDHLQSSRHSSEFRCCDCDRDFNSCDALDQHLRDKIHQRSSLSTRDLDNGLALTQYLASLTHVPPDKLACLSDGSCNKTFPCSSALLHHLESGACPSGMNRDKIKALVMKHDVDRLITRSPAGGGDLEETSSVESGSLVPTSWDTSCWSSVIVESFGTTSHSISDEPAFIHPEFLVHRCPLCPLERRPFRDATALRQHIESAAHCKPYVHCPVAISGGGRHGKSDHVRRFTTLSGLAQHLESAACKGDGARFRKLVKYMEMRFRDMDIRTKLDG